MPGLRLRAGQLGLGGRAEAGLDVAGPPRSASSARVARHGLCATPPKAIRTSRDPAVGRRRSAAATETSANA